MHHESAKSDRQPASTAPAGAGVRVLIADDDADLVDLLARRCRSLRYEVVTVDNATDAIQAIDACPPHVAIVDVGMPNGNGLAVCEMIASNPELNDIAMVVLTGKAKPEVVARCRQLGARYFKKGPGVWDTLEPILRSAGASLADAIAPAKATDAATQPTSDPEPNTLVDTVFAVLGVEDADGLRPADE